MRRPTMALATCLAVTAAHAGTLECHFTEPFFTVTFDSATGKVVLLSADETDPATGDPVPRTIAKGATLTAHPAQGWQELVLEGAGQTILTLKLTGRGSDGMSDRVYPFEALYGGRDGGCLTDKYPGYDPYDLLQDLDVSP